MRRLIAVVVTAVLVVAGVLVWVLRGGGGAHETAQRYLTAWQRGDYAAMRSLVADPATFTLARTESDLGVAGRRLKLVKTSGRTAAFDAALDLGGGRSWHYLGTLDLAKQSGHWRIAYSPASYYPGVQQGQRLRTVHAWPQRAAVLDTQGTPLTGSPSGSVQQLSGQVLAATAAQAKAIGPPYLQGDPIGTDGFEKQYEKRLAGRPGLTVQIVDGQNHVVKAVQQFPGSPGRTLQTTIDPVVQHAAGQALASVRKPASLVALKPSTGEILAVANKPGGYNRALLGQYPPGSTFKVITASALVAGGLGTDSKVPCPATTTINGRTFHNSKNEQFGTISLKLAFAYSCNTTFADLAVSKLGGQRLTRLAAQFGFGVPLITGLPAARAQLPAPADDTMLAADAFGQGQVLTTPLNMASVAGAIAAGTWNSPRFVAPADAAQAADAGGNQVAAPRKLDPAVVKALRSLMPAVVSEGTAKKVDFPSGTAGKTGTAEFGSGPNPPTHAWFIGYRGDLAFAVIVEGGGFGADVAAPIAAQFLKTLR